MPSLVLDSSALLALLLDEPGGDAVADLLPDAVMSAVNVAEVITRALDLGGTSPGDVFAWLRSLRIPFLPFDDKLALDAAVLRTTTRAAGLSLGDRACIATAASLGRAVATSDRRWATIKLPVEVRLFR